MEPISENGNVINDLSPNVIPARTWNETIYSLLNTNQNNYQAGSNNQTITTYNVSTSPVSGPFQSPNYIAGSRGWRLDSNGDLDASNGNFRGDITGASGTFSGTLTGGSLNIPDITTANSFHVDSSGNSWWGASVATGYATAPASILNTGVVKFASGTIGGFTLSATTLTGSNLVLDSTNQKISLGSGNNIVILDAADALYRLVVGNATYASAPFSVTKAGVVFASNISITGGSVVTSVLSGVIGQTNLNVANAGWTQTSAFSSSSATVVAWGAGTFTTASGTAYSISASNTGTMAAKTYVYLDTSVSTTAYQVTTTAATAVGAGKVLIAVCQNNTTESIFQVFGGSGGLNVDASNIVTGSITANEIAASTITGGKIAANTITGSLIAASTITATNLSVSQLSAIAADLGTVTAGILTLSASGYINSGQTDYATGTGFFLGISGGVTKFSIGNSTSYVHWDGTTLDIAGVSNVTKTYTSGEAITSGDAVCIGYYQSDGGIKFDTKATGSGQVVPAGATVTISFTVGSNSNRNLVLFLNLNSSEGNNPGTPAYNGSNMTNKSTESRAGGFKASSYILLAPSTGTHNLTFSVPSTGGAHTTYTYAIYSYYNCDQSGIDSFNSSSVSGVSTITTNNTIVNDGALIVSAVTANNISFSSGVNKQTNTASETGQTVTDMYTGDSGLVLPKATTSVTANMGSSDTFSLMCLALKPFTAITWGNVLQTQASTPSNSCNFTRYNSFIGFAKATVAANASVAVTIAGEVTGLSSLTSSPSFYYLSNSLGVISTTPGTNTRKVGISISTTSLLVTNIW